MRATNNTRIYGATGSVEWGVEQTRSSCCTHPLYSAGRFWRLSER